MHQSGSVSVWNLSTGSNHILCEAPLLLLNTQLFCESLASCHALSDSCVLSYRLRQQQIRTICFSCSSQCRLPRLSQQRSLISLETTFQWGRIKWSLYLMNWLCRHFSFLCPQRQHAALLGNNSRLRPTPALHNNGMHYFLVVGIVRVAFFPIYVNRNPFTALDSCPTCHFLSSPAFGVVANSTIWLYFRSDDRSQSRHTSIQTGSYHIECALSADVTCDHLRGVYTVSFPELEVLTLFEKKELDP